MNINDKNVDYVIENNSFRIVESLKNLQEKEALLILKKIEYILNNKIAYNASINDNYSNYTQDQLYTLLHDKAVQIHTEFNEKEPNKKTLIRKMNTIMKNLENSLNPSLLFPLKDDIMDVTNEITKHLDIADLGILAQVNRYGKKHANVSIVERARVLGFVGESHVKAIKYLNNLCKDFNKLLWSSIHLDPYFYRQDKLANILQNLSNVISNEDLLKLYHLHRYMRIQTYILFY